MFGEIIILLLGVLVGAFCLLVGIKMLMMVEWEEWLEEIVMILFAIAACLGGCVFFALVYDELVETFQWCLPHLLIYG